MNVRALPEADTETLDAALWYEDQRTGLGDNFLFERERAIEYLEANPRGMARLEYHDGPHEIRRVLMRRFPYAVIFRYRSEELLIVAVAHLKRRPLYRLGRVAGAGPR